MATELHPKSHTSSFCRTEQVITWGKTRWESPSLNKKVEAPTDKEQTPNQNQNGLGWFTLAFESHDQFKKTTFELKCCTYRGNPKIFIDIITPLTAGHPPREEHFLITSTVYCAFSNTCFSTVSHLGSPCWKKDNWCRINKQVIPNKLINKYWKVSLVIIGFVSSRWGTWTSISP